MVQREFAASEKERISMRQGTSSWTAASGMARVLTTAMT
jgi:hypothetical protein